MKFSLFYLSSNACENPLNKIQIKLFYKNPREEKQFLMVEDVNFSSVLAEQKCATSVNGKCQESVSE